MGFASNIIALSDDNQLEKLSELIAQHTLESKFDRSRFVQDFKQGIFKAFYVNDSNSDSIIAFVLITKGYSTWQHRLFAINALWLESRLDLNTKNTVLELLRSFLFEFARKLDCKRILYNLEINEKNKQLVDWLVLDGITNMTIKEEWSIFEMRHAAMTKFLEIKHKYSQDFRIIKVTDMKKYANAIRDLIRVLAVYEKLQDQCETSSASLVRDYASEEKFYESIIVLDKQENVVGYSFYSMIYELERGRGCFMDDLFIKEEFRGCGLGAALWREVMSDCLTNFDVRFMQWSVLKWNKPAIDFYFKFNSVDLTDVCSLNFFRYTTDRIYSNYREESLYTK